MKFMRLLMFGTVMLMNSGTPGQTGRFLIFVSQDSLGS